MTSVVGQLPKPVYALVKRQAGVVRRQQLLALGISPRTLHRRTQDGTFTARGRRVLVFVGTPAGLLTESLVVAHAAHPDGVLTGYSALAVCGLDADDPWSAVQPDPRPWIRIDQHQRLPARVIRATPGKGRSVLGVAVADRNQIVLDLMRFLPWSDAETLAYRAAQQLGPPLFTLISDAVDQLGAAPGVVQLRRIVALLSSGARSHAEQQTVQLMASAGITGFRLNHPVSVEGKLFFLDIALPDHMLAIEIDGQAFHIDPKRFQADRTRQNLLVQAGWRVLRFTWHDIVQRPEYVVSQIAQHL